MAVTKAERNEALRLEALKIAIALYGGYKGGNSNKFLVFAEEVFEFIQKDNPTDTAKDSASDKEA